MEKFRVAGEESKSKRFCALKAKRLTIYLEVEKDLTLELLKTEQLT